MIMAEAIMAMKNIYRVIYLSIMSLICGAPANAYDDKVTHPELTKAAVASSQLETYLMQNYGNQFAKGINLTLLNDKSVVNWLTAGSTAEDADRWPYCRRSTHFLNPLIPWNQAGLSELAICTMYNSPGYLSKYSALTWATGYEAQAGPIVSPNKQAMGWDNARNYFYSALSSAGNVERETNFAKSLQAVGQVLHLLQDMAVPAHVRNDFITSHLLQQGRSNPYELYVFNNNDMIKNLQKWQIDAVRPDFTASRLTDFWDTIEGASVAPYQIVAEVVSGDKSYQFKAGLAEYTNANFISEGTFFSNSNSFTYPKEESTQIIVRNMPDTLLKRPYYYKVADWDVGYILAGVDAISFAKYGLNSDAYSKTQKIPPLDKNVHQDYAERLVPLAIAYSAMLVDYFFRGTLEISAPDRCLYGIIDGAATPQQFTSLRAKVKNTSFIKDQTGNNIGLEEIKSGTLKAVAKYKKRTDYQPDLTNDPPTNESIEPDFSYSVSAPVFLTPDLVSAINSTIPKEFSFEFPADAAIPAGVTDLYLQVVFKGTLGNEQDNAIAVGMKDLGEPTHINFWNTTDYTYTAGRWDDSTQTLIPGQLQESNEAEKVTLNEKIAICPNYPVTHYDVQYMPEQPGEFGRIVSISDPGQQIWYFVEDAEINVPGAPVSSNWYSYKSVINQNGSYDDDVYTFRGKVFHSSTGYVKASQIDEGFWFADWLVGKNADAIPTTVFNFKW